jgi:hypothetical protein
MMIKITIDHWAFPLRLCRKGNSGYGLLFHMQRVDYAVSVPSYREISAIRRPRVCLVLSGLLWEAAHRPIWGESLRGLLFAQSGAKLGLQRVAGLAGCGPP